MPTRGVAAFTLVLRPILKATAKMLKLALFVVLALASLTLSEAWPSASIEASADAKICAPRDLSSIGTYYLFEVARTVEVAVRGFLLGFGLTLLKDFLVDGKRDPKDKQETLHFGMMVGFGMASALVGASLFIPASLRDSAMAFH